MRHLSHLGLIHHKQPSSAPPPILTPASPHATSLIQQWIQDQAEIAANYKLKNVPFQLQIRKGILKQCIREAETASLSDFLRAYCIEDAARTDLDLSYHIIEKLREKGVVKGLDRDEAYQELAADARYQWHLTKLLSCAGQPGMSKEEVARLLAEN